MHWTLAHSDQAVRTASTGRDVMQPADASAVRAIRVGRVVVEGNRPPWLIFLGTPLRWLVQI